MSNYEMRDDGLYCEGEKVSSNVNPADAAWEQGLREMVGYRDQRRSDMHTCEACHRSYSVRRQVRFVAGMGLLAEYIPAPDPGCQNTKCSMFKSA